MEEEEEETIKRNPSQFFTDHVIILCKSSNVLFKTKIPVTDSMIWAVLIPKLKNRMMTNMGGLYLEKIASKFHKLLHYKVLISSIQDKIFALYPSQHQHKFLRFKTLLSSKKYIVSLLSVSIWLIYVGCVNLWKFQF